MVAAHGSILPHSAPMRRSHGLDGAYRSDPAIEGTRWAHSDRIVLRHPIEHAQRYPIAPSRLPRRAATMILGPSGVPGERAFQLA
jgi:hypothetical protein